MAIQGYPWWMQFLAQRNAATPASALSSPATNADIWNRMMEQTLRDSPDLASPANEDIKNYEDPNFGSQMPPPVGDFDLGEDLAPPLPEGAPPTRTFTNPPTSETMFPASIFTPGNPAPNESMLPTATGTFVPNNPPPGETMFPPPTFLPEQFTNPSTNEFMPPPTVDFYQPQDFFNPAPSELMFPTGAGEFTNPAPNEAMTPSGVGPGINQAPDESMLPTTIANLTNPAPNEDMFPTGITDLTNPAPNEDMVADPNDFFFTGDEPAPPTDLPTDGTETPPSTATPPAAVEDPENPGGDRIDFNDSGFDFNNVGGPNMGMPAGVGGSPSFFGGTFANRGGFTPGSFAPIAGGASILPYQLAMFHGIWSGAKPMSYDTWRAQQAWSNYQGSPFGNKGSTGGIAGSYQNYINTWNSLRSAGISSQGHLQSAAAAAAEPSGAGPSGAGRPMTVSR